MQKQTLAFDVYGTLIDTHGLLSLLQSFMGDKAVAFSELWRDKQLEYSFRRGLMQQYQPFSVCTDQALQYTCQRLKVSLNQAQLQQLLHGYKSLPAFADAPGCLRQLHDRGLRLYAFSNGDPEDVAGLLQNAGISGYFQGVISVHAVGSFKPDPQVYDYFLQATGAVADETWLVSSNPFDVLGALACEWRAAWIDRTSQMPFDPWTVSPTLTTNSLANLPHMLETLHG